MHKISSYHGAFVDAEGGGGGLKCKVMKADKFIHFFVNTRGLPL